MTIVSQLRRPGKFRNTLHLEPEAFLSQTASCYVDNVTFPRDYLMRIDHSLTGLCEKMRKCQITDLNRALHVIMWTRNISASALAKLFAPQHINPIVSNGEEYHYLRCWLFPFFF